jgi:phage shock protein PspC (stress-responsive transcriptional regulator)
MTGRPLRKSNDRIIAGVCAGLADWLGWPANRTRLAYVVLSILSAAFPGALVYLILWIAMPGPDSNHP